jgi:hypothetical protein
MMTPPNGLPEIMKLYGDPALYVRQDGTVSPIWECRMVIVPFPSPLPLGWALEKLAAGCRVNQAIAQQVEALFRALVAGGAWSHIRTFDGGYNWRPKRSSSRSISMHAFGAALDFNAETNRQGTDGDMDPRIVKIAEEQRWTWGGRWSGAARDDMHFQWGSGY